MTTSSPRQAESSTLSSSVPEAEQYLREQEAELYQQVMEYEMDTGRYNMMSSIGRTNGQLIT
ncbi:tail fiber protein / tail tubular protein A [Enterobacter phage 01_vB_Eclo_IJM]|nr:tail fiber protein / tail tubular protein A [Enterobacter phage 01_vB_Eclo_IJM]